VRQKEDDIALTWSSNLSADSKVVPTREFSWWSKENGTYIGIEEMKMAQNSSVSVLMAYTALMSKERGIVIVINR
jgi:hypothetical protein